MRLLWLAVAIACSKGGSNVTTIGIAGGTVEVPGEVTVTIPPNALASDVGIVVAQVAGAPAGAVTQLLQFTPDGTSFAQPVTVTFELPPGINAGNVYWSRAGSDGYDPLPTTIANRTATAKVSHFSRGFVGAACTQNGACQPANVCRTGALACTSGTPVCSESGNAPEGSPCGDGNVCSVGACVAPATSVAVTISPKTASVTAGGTVTFTASVTGTSNTQVTWSADSGAVTNGAFTAPGTAGTAHVAVTSRADATKKDTATVTVTMPTAPPAAPAGLTATGNCQSITLAWSAAPDAATYLVKRSTAPGGPFTATTASVYATATGWALTEGSLQPASRYYYQVTAQNAAGSSAPATANATTLAAGPAFFDPNGTGTLLYLGDTQVSFAWTAPPGAALTISRVVPGAATSTVLAQHYTATSFTDTTAQPGTTYQYTLAIEGTAACQDHQTGTTGAAGSAVKQAVQAKTTWVTESTLGSTWVDLAATYGEPYAVHVNGSQWTLYRGLSTADGHFTIPNVPAGPNYLRGAGLGGLFTAARVFDVSSVQFGRGDEADPAGATPLTVSVSGLSPWGADHLVLFSLLSPFLDPGGLGAWAQVDQLTSAPAASATSASLTFDANGNLALVQPSKGDVAYLHQLVDTAGTPYRYLAAKRACTASLDHDMASGSAATASCALTAPASTSVTIDWQRSAYAALGAAQGPSPVPDLANSSFQLESVPAASSYMAAGLNLVSPVEVALTLDSATADVTETVSLPAALPAPFWTPFYSLRLQYDVAVTAPATAACATPAPANLPVWITQTGPVSELASRLVPEVGVPGPVTVTKLADLSAQPSQIGNGAPLQVSWTAPTAGTHAPTRYRVTALLMDVSGTCATTLTQAGVIWTTGDQTSVVFPPKTFSPGQAYLFYVRAMWAPDEPDGLAAPQQFFSSTRFANAFRVGAPLTD